MWIIVQGYDAEMLQTQTLLGGLVHLTMQRRMDMLSTPQHGITANPKQELCVINESLLTSMILFTSEETSDPPFWGDRELSAISQLQLCYMWELWVS